nr:twin-arginine translocase TatA/TatE family subunit [Candidatus Sulfidibacterium hydrothermale]
MDAFLIQRAGMFGTPEIILIVLAIVLLFGGKKIPELMRGIGKGVKEFKAGINEEGKKEKTENPPPEKK